MRKSASWALSFSFKKLWVTVRQTPFPFSPYIMPLAHCCPILWCALKKEGTTIRYLEEADQPNEKGVDTPCVQTIAESNAKLTLSILADPTFPEYVRSVAVLFPLPSCCAIHDWF
jgi:hypothetical protein